MTQAVRPVRPEAVVTLVHGTWAKRAPWTDDDSALCVRLREAFEDGAIVERFDWSGGNSVAARDAAARDLKAHLASVAEAHPDASSFVIAHSHGGNVALKALASGTCPRVSGLVCLSTPVLVTRRRQFDPFVSMLLNFIGVLPLLLLSIWLEPKIGEDAAALGWFGLSALSVLAIRRLRRRFAAMEMSNDYSAIDSERVIFLRTAGDEAAIAIGAAHLLSLVVQKLATFPLLIIALLITWHEAVRSVLMAHRMLAGIILGLLFVSLFFGGVAEEGSWLETYRKIGLVVIIAAAAIFLNLFTLVTMFFLLSYASALLIPMLVVIAVASLAIGPGLTLAAVATYITGEPCPPGRWTVLQLPEDEVDTEAASFGALQHSLTYQSPVALAAITGWIDERRADRRRRIHAALDALLAEAPGR